MTYTDSCGQVVEIYERGIKEGISATGVTKWLEGYVTAYNRLMPDTVNILGNSDVKSASLWVYNWCNSNPLNDLSKAASALTDERYGLFKRMRGEP
jgi:hypothetical protein